MFYWNNINLASADLQNHLFSESYVISYDIESSIMSPVNADFERLSPVLLLCLVDDVYKWKSCSDNTAKYEW